MKKLMILLLASIHILSLSPALADNSKTEEAIKALIDQNTKQIDDDLKKLGALEQLLADKEKVIKNGNRIYAVGVSAFVPGLFSMRVFPAIYEGITNRSLNKVVVFSVAGSLMLIGTITMFKGSQVIEVGEEQYNSVMKKIEVVKADLLKKKIEIEALKSVLN